MPGTPRASAVLLLVAGASLLAGPPAPAAEPRNGLLRQLPAPVLSPRATACTGGAVYDDDSFEDRYNFQEEPVLDMVMRFDLASAPVDLQRVCVCWTRTGGDDRVTFDMLVYDASGPARSPGDLVTGLAGVEATGIPFFPAVAFYDLDLSALGISLPDDQLFLGVSWDTTQDAQVYLCGDTDGPNDRPLFFSTDVGASWTDLNTLVPDARALGVRAEVGGGGAFECVPDDTTLCLNDGRFQARLDWERPTGQTGQGHVVPFGTDDSGLLWFFRAENWEMLVKVLDSCSFNDRYWVFFAAVTNVEFTLEVVDSQTGERQEYHNVQGVSAPAVTDTQAFATCP